MADLITQDQLKTQVSYDPETGVFMRIKFHGKQISGKPLGTLMRWGYVQCRIMGNTYLMHRIAWLYVYGQYPQGEVDHINGVRSDNRIVNLRDVSHKQNQENQKLIIRNSSGYRGVSWTEHAKKWRAYVCHHDDRQHLGYFDSVEEAAAIAKEARNRLFTHHFTSHSA